jgi:hypothetical protein
MEALYSRCCGLDVHKSSITACVLLEQSQKRGKHIRRFGCTTRELRELVTWLRELGVEHVAMESTGVYWKPVWNTLESNFHVVLANAQHIKAVPGMKEEAYRSLTYDLTVSVARTLAKLNLAMTFIYVSGAGTDSTERGRLMWARVKGRTENTLLEMPFKAVYLFRPAYIQPLHGVRTKTAWYGAVYAVMRPFYPVWKMLFPNYVTTTECVGRAMLNVTKRGFPKPVVENRDINRMCAKEA